MPEERIGLVMHYFGHIQVASVLLEKPLQVGDKIHVKGHTSNFTQAVSSLQLEHREVDAGSPGEEVALKVVEHARQHDEVFRVT